VLRSKLDRRYGQGQRLGRSVPVISAPQLCTAALSTLAATATTEAGEGRSSARSDGFAVEFAKLDALGRGVEEDRVERCCRGGPGDGGGGARTPGSLKRCAALRRGARRCDHRRGARTGLVATAGVRLRARVGDSYRRRHDGQGDRQRAAESARSGPHRRRRGAQDPVTKPTTFGGSTARVACARSRVPKSGSARTCQGRDEEGAQLTKGACLAIRA